MYTSLNIRPKYKKKNTASSLHGCVYFSITFYLMSHHYFDFTTHRKDRIVINIIIIKFTEMESLQSINRNIIHTDAHDYTECIFSIICIHTTCEAFIKRLFLKHTIYYTQCLVCNQCRFNALSTSEKGKLNVKRFHEYKSFLRPHMELYVICNKLNLVMFICVLTFKSELIMCTRSNYHISIIHPAVRHFEEGYNVENYYL